MGCSFSFHCSFRLYAPQITQLFKQVRFLLYVFKLGLGDTAKFGINLIPWYHWYWYFHVIHVEIQYFCWLEQNWLGTSVDHISRQQNVSLWLLPCPPRSHMTARQQSGAGEQEEEQSVQCKMRKEQLFARTCLFCNWTGASWQLATHCRSHHIGISLIPIPPLVSISSLYSPLLLNWNSYINLHLYHKTLFPTLNRVWIPSHQWHFWTHSEIFSPL